MLKYAEDGDIEDARAAAPLSLANLPGESEANAYCAVVSAVDRLGNESSLPGKIDDGSCLIAGDAAVISDDGMVVENPATLGSYEALLEDLRVANAMMDDAGTITAKADAIETAMDGLADAGLLVGVDITPPGIETDEDAIRFNTGNVSLDIDVYDDENADSNSGLHTLPLLVTAQIRDTDDTDCLDITGEPDADAGAVGTTSEDCDDPTALEEDTRVVFTAPAHAYYTVRGAALDKAGNYSAPLSHTFVFDNEIATATAPAAPRIDAGEAFQVASFLNDDLSIRDYYVTVNFAATGGGDAIRLGVVHPTVVDAFDADPLMNRNVSVSANVDTYAGLQADPATGPVTTLTGVSVAVRDQADSEGANDGTPATTTIVVVDAADIEDGFEDDVRKCVHSFGTRHLRC